MLNQSSLSHLFEFAVETVYLAGRLTLGYYQTDLQPEYKSDDSPVTLADRKAEELIRSRIESTYPEHQIIGEEYGGRESGASSHCWIIDPIDGTKSFIRGVPLYAVLIGLQVDGVVEVGAAYFPALDEMICAASGMGCWWNGRRAKVSTVDVLSRSFLTTTSVQAFGKYGKSPVINRLMQRCYYQVGWGDAYGYLLVATGRAEIMLDARMSIWDCGPFPPILSEAGGYFGDWQGNPTIHSTESLATNNVLLPQVLELINQKD